MTVQDLTVWMKYLDKFKDDYQNKPNFMHISLVDFKNKIQID